MSEDLPAAAAPGGFPLGARLKRLRLQLGISQRELARRADTTNGNLSQIESGSVSPSFSTLEKILQALGVTPANFFAEQIAWVPAVVRAADFLQITKNSVHFAVMPVTEAQPAGLHLLQQTLPPDTSINTDWHGHEGVLAGIVVSGQLQLKLDGESFQLLPGDGFHFAMHRRFQLQNNGLTSCTLVAVSIVEPILT